MVDDFFHQKRVMITGATGLVGLNLIKRMLQMRKSGIDVDIHGTHLSKIPSMIALEYDLQNVNLIRADLTNPRDTEKLGQYDIIIHAAGYGQPGKFLENKIKTLLLNSIVNVKLFEKLKVGGSFLNISSSEVYSGNQECPHKEDVIGFTTPSHSRAPYIEGKRFGETISHIMNEDGLNVKNIRLSLTFGPGTKQGDARVLNNFIERALRFNEIALLDFGTAVRRYIYIEDTIEIFLNILVKGHHVTYNVGGTEDITIYELAKHVATLTGSDLILPEVENKAPGAPDRVGVDMTRYTKEFGDLQLTPINEGLNRTINYQRKLYGIER